MTVATGLSQQVYSRLGITAFMQGNRWKREHLARLRTDLLQPQALRFTTRQRFITMRLANADSYTIHMKFKFFFGLFGDGVALLCSAFVLD